MGQSLGLGKKTELDPEKRYGDDQIQFKDSYYQAWAQKVEDRRTNGYDPIVKWGTFGYAVPIGAIMGYFLMRRFKLSRIPNVQTKRFAAVLTKPEEITKFNQFRLSTTWPTVLSTLESHNIKNLTVYRKDVPEEDKEEDKNFLFTHFEYCGNDLDGDLGELYKHPSTQGWLQLWGGREEEGKVYFPRLEEYYHDGRSPIQFEK